MMRKEGAAGGLARGKTSLGCVGKDSSAMPVSSIYRTFVVSIVVLSGTRWHRLQVQFLVDAIIPQVGF